ncbi:hypothetical protein J3R30DRAFT_1364065 [Lentinula aciculospora]|uniref:DUF6699 domain-containing protein n=1 Tax=Lentinula aciculospora TaxID=153920 RepID=A0A9W9APU2_9AGAR|nr:hypothetical protein J3R30DRAFT_1364065 [Lentinula aciculospora]
MPGKTVRFVTPSPSYSVASLPKIDGSISPQPIPSSMLPAVDCQLHPVLQNNRSLPPAIAWDMAYPVATARLHPTWAQSNWDAPATSPLVTNLVVTFGAWRFSIVPRPASGLAYVTVLDVLHGIYRYLRTTSSERDFQALSLDKRHRVTSAYNRRWQRCHIFEQETEQKKGVKQIDFLADSRFFWGLSPTKELGTWQLQVTRS